MPSSIVISSLDDGRFVEVNKAFTQLHGLTRDEVIGCTARELGLWADPDRRDELVQRLKSGEVVRNVPVLMRGPGGQMRHCLCSAEILEMRGRKYVFSAVHDITERAMAEENVRRLERLEAAGQLAANVAVDFGNALTVIQGNGAMLLARDDMPTDSVGHVREILRSASYAAGLTRQLMLFGRRHATNPIRMATRSLLERCARILRRELPETVFLDVGESELAADLFIDWETIEQAVLNIVVNAREAMENHGRVRLEVVERVVDAGHVRRHPQARPGRFACIRISDTGCGIATESIGRIFDPSFTTKRDTNGAGLGLAVVHGIVQQHAGWLEVESAVGAGTTVSIHLPLAHLEAAARLPTSFALGDNASGKCVLVAEDRDAVRSIIGVCLREFGLQPLLAADSETALGLWNEHKDNIVLLLADLILPGGMGGRELARVIRMEKPHIKVVYSSGFVGETVDAQQLVDDDSRFLAKPFGFEQLQDVVNSLLLGPERPR